jgi:hypothetical protein
MFKNIGLFVLGLLLMAGEAMAQVFPVDAATSTTITSVKGDIVAWGVVFIGVALTIFAYKRVKSLCSGQAIGRWPGKAAVFLKVSMVLATVATDLPIRNALAASHRMGGGSDWRRADRVCRDLGAPVDPGLSAHTPGQP